MLLVIHHQEAAAMATTKPRINVTLEPHRYALFKRLAALQGVSMSSLIGELLEAVAEPMERVCVVLEAAAKAPEELRTGLREAVDKAEASIMPNALSTLEQFDLFLGACEGMTGAATTGGRAADAGAVASPNPRPVTRGSTPVRKAKPAAGAKPTKRKQGAASRGGKA